ncbi:hypothetical protein [Rhizobium mayense]|uniref:Uncharacterized protein n=1 Tax=Rhizobium mayense TaxID=1312184 RepID=A0ABT7K5T9_9HYPH|nr:hypothetical protein [Rhizobium mayense]MDL2403517.1 hypothetical protein [Rhizobium mayense]
MPKFTFVPPAEYRILVTSDSVAIASPEAEQKGKTDPNDQIFPPGEPVDITIPDDFDFSALPDEQDPPWFTAIRSPGPVISVYPNVEALIDDAKHSAVRNSVGLELNGKLDLWPLAEAFHNDLKERGLTVHLIRGPDHDRY